MPAPLKNRPIASWKAGDLVQGFAFLRRKETRQDKGGRSYLDLEAGQPDHLADLRNRFSPGRGQRHHVGPAFPQLQPVMGSIPGFKAFIAAVFGGIGSIPGAVVGGIMLGVIEIMAVAFFPDLAGYRDAFAFILLIVILLIKPTGLMGERLEDKV